MHLKVPLHYLRTGDGLADATTAAAGPQDASVLASLNRLNGVINDVGQLGAAVYLGTVRN